MATDVKVENFRTRRQMESTLFSLLNGNWEIKTQSGHFSGSPFGRLFPLLSPKVTVVLTRNRG